MITLSVNVNKVATVRNSRGGTVPSVLDAVRVCLEAGAPGITVHPRADGRHITAADVHEIARDLAARRPQHAALPGDITPRSDAGTSAGAGRAGGVPAGAAGPDRAVEFNIEGDPRPDLLALVHEVRPTQCTLVPVRPGEITSQAGWPPETPAAEMRRLVSELRAAGIRVSLFVDPESRAIDWAAEVGADRVELYTEPFARAFERGGPDADRSYETYVQAAGRAHALGLGVNAGHDLDLANLVRFRELPHLDEVSIGHALISHALFVGLARSVADYLQVLSR